MLLQMAISHSFSWLNNIRVCVCIPQLLKPKIVSCWALELFPCLGYRNGAAVNIGMHISF